MRKRWIVAGVAVAFFGTVTLINASWLAPAPTGVPRVLAHRGIHQEFSRTGLKNDDCTATRIHPPTHPYLENTILSMRASFAAGADAIELDVHPTTDGEFAVFHDWGLECRTNGKGVTRRQSMAYLRTLDLGYGYTADGGKSFPFRGKGVGMMPTLEEVLAAFPDKRILINIKSNDAYEADALVRYLKAHGRPVDGRLYVWADGKPGDRLAEIAPEAHVVGRKRMKACGYAYLAWGWSGHVPEICRSTGFIVPTDMRWALWGWPNRFLDRMQRAGVEVQIAGPIGGDQGSGLVRPEELDAVPQGFGGFVITDEIAVIGPEVRRRWPRE